jgi:RND family efflux transporter MFP subunit
MAQIANAEAALRNAGVQYSRERRSPQSRSMMDQMMPGMGDMFGGKSKVDRRADLYQHQVQIEQARSSLYQAQSQLQEVDAKLKDTKSIAPFNGVIVTKHVDKGDTVQPGQPLLEFADVTALQVQVDVPARLAGGLVPGYPVKVRLDDAAQTEVTATVSQVFPVADPVRHTVRTKFDLPRGALGKPGMYAEVMLSDPAAVSGQYPVVPASAVVWRGGLPYAYVVTPDNRTSLRLLRLGDTVGDQVTVLTGLAGGERVVNHPR